MENNSSMTGEELKSLRKEMDWTQPQLAAALGVTKRTIVNYESAKKIPDSKAKMLHLFFDSFKELEQQGLVKPTKYTQNPEEIKVNEPSGYIKNKNGLLYEELPNGKFLVEVPQVPYNAYASFIEVYGDEYATKEAFGTTYFTVDHPGKGGYISFVVRNDSMWNEGGYDTPSGAEILGRELQKHHWKDGFRESIYGWIIISQDGMFHKDIEGPDANGYINCKSRNPSPEFPDFKLNLNQVHTIWKVIKRTF